MLRMPTLIFENLFLASGVWRNNPATAWLNSVNSSTLRHLLLLQKPKTTLNEQFTNKVTLASLTLVSSMLYICKICIGSSRSRYLYIAEDKSRGMKQITQARDSTIELPSA